MKKGLLILLTVSMITVLTACGSSGESTSEEATNTETTAKEDTTEYTTATYKGMTYSYPADSEFKEENDVVNIALGDSEAVVMIMSLDLSVSDDTYSDNLDTLLDLTLSSMTSGFDDVQTDSTEDLTIAGCTAKEATGTVSSSGTPLQYDGVAIYKEGDQFIYAIMYGAKSDDAGLLSEYQALLDSISFEEEPTENSAYENDTNASSDEASDVIKSEDGYDITYQKYDLFENSQGTIYMNAIVEIQNTGDTSLELKTSSFTLTDSSGSLVGMVSYTNEDPKVVEPGYYGYYYVNAASVDGDVSVDGDYTFVPELTVKETDKIPVMYPVSDVSDSEGKYGKIDIMGRVNNPTSEDKSTLWIAFILYDNDDYPLAAYGTNVHDLAAGETQSFDADAAVLVNQDFTFEDVSWYEVYAED